MKANGTKYERGMLINIENNRTVEVWFELCELGGWLLAPEYDTMEIRALLGKPWRGNVRAIVGGAIYRTSVDWGRAIVLTRRYGALIPRSGPGMPM